ncbi:MAG: NADH-quinone oxidoreductase subunit L [Myxococcales bacterium]|nr:NADH-quinone oxidoreductase subunit L [Myxococcales bacterium]
MDFGFAIERTLLWIVLLPFFGAMLNGIFGRSSSRTVVSSVGVGAVAGSFVLALIACTELFRGGEVLVFNVYEWFSIGVGTHVIPIHVSLMLDRLSGVMTLMVTSVGLLIHIYSMGYMHDDPAYGRFFAYLNLFMGSMLLLVLADCMPVMFVGWEGVGLCSYLLIGFWYDNATYAAAGRKAFVVNRIGDFGVLLAMFLLASTVYSLDFHDINAQSTHLLGALWPGHSALTMTLATAVGLLIMLGCAGKSAQIPLYVWLPDAMAGPTPVSALIHAATMVTAGVYLCARLSPVLVQSPTVMMVIASVGAATALFAATIAVTQREMKRVLAYSTVSQLGFMFAAVGTGAFAAGVFHVFTHAFFKACLFLGAGSVMHAVAAHGDADLFKLGGLRKALPRTHWTFLVSCIAIAGLPGFSGFFSKDEILLGAALAGTHTGAQYFAWPWFGWLIWGALLLAATLTSFYMFRLYFLTFSGSFRGTGHPHESPLSMTFPLAALATGAALSGYLGFPHALHVLPNLWSIWFAPVFGTATETIHGTSEHVEPGIVWLSMASGTGAAVIGLLTAFVMYKGGRLSAGEKLAHAMPRLYRGSLAKWHVDELYQLFIIGPMTKLARLSAGIDRVVVDGLTHLTGALVRMAGYGVSRFQSGIIFAYSAAMMIGMLGLGWWLLFPHGEVFAFSKDTEVHFRATEGMGYSYRWDFNSDGEFDTDWSRDAQRARRRYDVTDVQGGGVRIEGGQLAPGYRRIYLRLGEQRTLDLGGMLYGSTWRDLRGRQAVKGLPTIRYGAAILSAPGHAVELEPGELPANLLGAWHQSGKRFRLPTLAISGDHYTLDPQGGRVLFKGKLLRTPFAMRPGDTVRIGQARLRISGSIFIRPYGTPLRLGLDQGAASERVIELRAGERAYLGSPDAGLIIAAENWVEATVAIRSAFGNTARRKVRAILNLTATRPAPGEVPTLVGTRASLKEAG